MFIHFDTKAQAERIMRIIDCHVNDSRMFSYISYNGGDTISLSIEEGYETSLLIAFREAFLAFIRTDMMHVWLGRILEEDFHYSDKTEREHIIEITASVMHGDNPKNEAFWNELKYKIHHGLISLFEKKVSFSFPSFLTFRMKGIMEKLMAYAETGIDEYKMEQEYQGFIHILRSHMLRMDHKMERLHLKHRQTFEFFGDTLEILTRDHLSGFIDRKLYSEYPMYIDSHVLAPLISIAPKQLYIYSDEEQHPLVVTIQRIFEERAIMRPVIEFGKNGLKTF